jgi:hypothetical protein
MFVLFLEVPKNISFVVPAIPPPWPGLFMQGGVYRGVYGVCRGVLGVYVWCMYMYIGVYMGCVEAC